MHPYDIYIYILSACSGAGPINLFRIQYFITRFIKNSLNASLNLSMKLSMKHSMDFGAHHVHPHPMVFAYVFLTFATVPSNLMESIKGGGAPPPVMEAAEGSLH